GRLGPGAALGTGRRLGAPADERPERQRDRGSRAGGGREGERVADLAAVGPQDLLDEAGDGRAGRAARVEIDRKPLRRADREAPAAAHAEEEPALRAGDPDRALERRRGEALEPERARRHDLREIEEV